jgi:hypothetical protein
VQQTVDSQHFVASDATPCFHICSSCGGRGANKRSLQDRFKRSTPWEIKLAAPAQAEQALAATQGSLPPLLTRLELQNPAADLPARRRRLSQQTTTATGAGTARRPGQPTVRRRPPGPAVVHRHHRTPHRRRHGLLRRGPRRVQPAGRRLVHRRPHALRAGRRRPGDGLLAPPTHTGRDRALRPRRQYTSWIFGHRLRAAGLLGSMGRVASSVDNTMIEVVRSTMQRELLDRQHWTSRDQLASAIFEWIEALCNPIRRHSPSPTSAPPPTTPYTPPPEPRHDHHTNRVREGVSSSKHPG